MFPGFGSSSSSNSSRSSSPKSAKRLFNIMSPVLFDSRPDSNGNIASKRGGDGAPEPTSELRTASGHHTKHSPCEMKTSNPRFKSESDRHVNRVSFQRSYRVTYLGHTILDRRYTLPMLPWIISDIKNQGKTNGQDIYLEVTESSLRAISCRGERTIFEHSLQNISKFAQTAQDPCCFTYLIRETPDVPFSCYVFRAADENLVLELFTTMREASKEMAQHHGPSQLTRISSGTSLDTILTNSQQYEVMYVGKIKLPQKRAPPTFIDDAVEKFRNHELEKLRAQNQDQKNRHRHGSGASVSSLPYNLDLVEAPKENELAAQVGRVNKGSFGSGNRDLSSSSEHSSLDNIAEHSGSESKDGSSEFCIFDGLKQRSASPSPTLSRETLTPSSQSLITHTQSMDNATKETVLHDLKEDPASSGSTLKPSPVSPTMSLIPNTQSLDATGKANVMQDLQECIGPTQRVRSISGDVPRTSKQISLPLYRTRVGSGGAADMKRPRADTAPSSNRNNNRTMLFLIGRLELCLISTDRKQVLLNKTFNYVSHCSQGVKYPDHFGFICRETSFNAAEVYVGYVFRCQTEKVVEEIMHALKQAFHTAHQAYQHQVQQQQQSCKAHIITCETCPMHWFHRLCCDVEGVSAEKAQAIILQRLDFLTDSEQDEIMTKYQGSDVNNIQEQNEVFMMLIRTICERKQSKHFHSANVTRNEHHGFLDRKMSSSKLDHLKQKAKKSLSSSFETILKRKSREEQIRDRSVTLETDGTTRITHHEEAAEEKRPEVPQTSHTLDFPDGRLTYDKENLSPVSSARPRSSTIGTMREVRKEAKQRAQTDPELVQPKSPIMNIFMKVGNQNKPSPTSDSENATSSKDKGSWRRNIFHKVQAPVPSEEKALVAEKPAEKFLIEVQPPKRSTEELRELWRKAIMEQIILIRMERENKRLQAKQSAASHKRMKLDYEEITPCLKAAAQQWEELLNQSEDSEEIIDFSVLQEAVKAGIPRHKRGDIWQFLAKQYCLREKPPETSSEIDLTIPYEDLLKQLTSHQHTILVDLGRTFPRHPYFSQPLGAGQLSLFNLLKGYSLLDKEVGYCQGLSFVAGILLLHMSEDQAFSLMKHMLFNLALRGQYKPDMMALQRQLYCLTRLLHDHHHDLYQHFEQHDIPPTLYAAPWFLTLFASQFPLGFVARLFDLIFLEGLETMYKVALALLANHKEALLQCTSFESIMDFLKTIMPTVNIIQMERIFSQVFSMDIRKQLITFEIEYHVLQEEMMMAPPRPPPPPPPPVDNSIIQKLENANKTLQHQKQVLEEQLQAAQTSIHGLEESIAGHQSTVTRLEARLRSVEEERDALLHSVQVLRRRVDLLEQGSPSGNNSLKDMSRSRTPSLNVVRALGAEMQSELGSPEGERHDEASENESSANTAIEEDGAEEGVHVGAPRRSRSGSSDSCSSAHSSSFGGSL